MFFDTQHWRPLTSTLTQPQSQQKPTNNVPLHLCIMLSCKFSGKYSTKNVWVQSWECIDYKSTSISDHPLKLWLAWNRMVFSFFNVPFTASMVLKASPLFHYMECSTAKGHMDLQEEITKLIKGSWAFGAMDGGVEYSRRTTAKSPGHFSLCWEERERKHAHYNEKEKHANQMKHCKGAWRSPALMKWIICQKYSTLFHA